MTKVEGFSTGHRCRRLTSTAVKWPDWRLTDLSTNETTASETTARGWEAVTAVTCDTHNIWRVCVCVTMTHWQRVCWCSHAALHFRLMMLHKGGERWDIPQCLAASPLGQSISKCGVFFSHTGVITIYLQGAVRDIVLISFWELNLRHLVGWQPASLPWVNVDK